MADSVKCAARVNSPPFAVDQEGSEAMEGKKRGMAERALKCLTRERTVCGWKRSLFAWYIARSRTTSQVCRVSSLGMPSRPSGARGGDASVGGTKYTQN
jgi:hypothetical protein